MNRITLHGCGAIAALAFAMLAWGSRTTPQINVWLLLGLIAAAWTGTLGALACARNVNERSLLVAVWGWAVVFRLMGLIGEPILEDDYFRYLWDGRQFAVSGNPYATPPAGHFADTSIPDKFQTILSNINNPHLPTIYGPVCEYVFLVGYWMAPGELWPVKLLLIVADLVVLGFLLRLTTPRWALLYAWCPLLIQEVAFTAHPEILGMVFAVGAWVAARRGNAFLTGVCCAAAVAARIHAVLLVPFLFCALHGRKSVGFRLPDLRCAMTFVATLVVLYAPFWLQGSAADLTALRAFLAEWEFNSSIFGMLKLAVGHDTAKWVCTGLFGFIYAWILARHCKDGMMAPRQMVPGDLVFGVFLLLSAVVNPWYVLWLAPFVAIRPSLIGMVALMAVTLSYLHGANLGWTELGAYDHPKWLRPLEYGLILAAALIQWRRNLIATKGKTD